MGSLVYYNDNDPFVIDWLRGLIRAGKLPDGDLDDRSIEEVQPDDLVGYRQVHLFAGIGGWPLALQWAGWPADKPIWTASCPCPIVSSAGKQTICPRCTSKNIVWCPRRTGYALCGNCQNAWFADARHLWPECWRLAAICRPERIFGEQSESPDGWNWVASVQASLEILGYSVGVSDLPASGIGAPHRRQRIYWVADSSSERRRTGHRSTHGELHGDKPAGIRGDGGGGMADTNGERRKREEIYAGRGGPEQTKTDESRIVDRLADTDGRQGQQDTRAIHGIQRREGREEKDHESGCTGEDARGMADSSGKYGRTGTGGEDGTETVHSGGVVDSIKSGLEGHAGDGDGGDEPRRHDAQKGRPVAETSAFSGMENSRCPTGEHEGHPDEGRGIKETDQGREADNACGSSGDGTGASGGLGDSESGEQWWIRESSEGGRREIKIGGSGAWDDIEFIPCTDGRWRPVGAIESDILLLADGFWYRMADVYSAIISQAIRGVEVYAGETETRPDKVLLMVQEEIGTEAFQREIGRQEFIFEKEVLLTFLRDILSALNGTTDCGSSQEACPQDRKIELRDLRNVIESECPSYRWQPNEQQTGESSTPLRELSFFLARCCQACGDCESRTNATYLPVSTTVVTARVGMLRGLGNAIVPQVGAEFIRAFMEIRDIQP